MSDPIPLSAPDGTVYAWACGVCHHVATTGERVHAHTAADIAENAEDRRRAATECCRCKVCGRAECRFDAWQSWTSLDDKPTWGVCRACWDGGERDRAEAWRAAQTARVEAEQRAREASVEASLDAASAWQLRDEIGELSEEHWCAGWLSGIERELWTAVVTGEHHRYGAAVDVLRDLSERCGGWWTYERFVPAEEWRRLYESEGT